MNQPLRILVVDDHAVVREGVRIVIERQPGWEVCGFAGYGGEAVEKALALQPDVVVLDLHMPDMGGLEVVRTLKEQKTAAEFVIFSAERAERAIEELFEAGVRSFIEKGEAADSLVAAIQAAAEHRPFFTPAVSAILFAKFIHAGEEKSGAKPTASTKLTARERQVVRLLTAGRSNKEVAAKLGISPRTAEAHRAAILRKLHLDSVASLIRYAIRNHMIEA